MLPKSAWGNPRVLRVRPSAPPELTHQSSLQCTWVWREREKLIQKVFHQAMQNTLPIVGRPSIRTQQSEHRREASPDLIEVRTIAVTTVALKSYSPNLASTIIKRKFESLRYRRLICSRVFV